MSNGEENTCEIKGNAQKYGPKSANKLMLYVNQNKTSSDNKPSIVGYMTDKDMNLSSVSLWKGKTKKGAIKFSGVHEDLAIKQNVVEFPKKDKSDNLDDDVPFYPK